MEIVVNEEKAKELKECLEILLAIELLEYHNKNWLASFANKSPKILNEEKRRLIQRCLDITGTTDTGVHT
jgi:hypothetical protein